MRPGRSGARARLDLVDDCGALFLAVGLEVALPVAVEVVIRRTLPRRSTGVFQIAVRTM
jgi:hypothetical protein